MVEFNARLGDPETQALMHRMASDFVEPLFAAAHGALDETPLEWKADPSVCVVLAAAGYPGAVRTGDAITGLDEVHEATVFQAGTKLDKNGLVTSGRPCSRSHRERRDSRSGDEQRIQRSSQNPFRWHALPERYRAKGPETLVGCPGKIGHEPPFRERNCSVSVPGPIGRRAAR